MTGVLREVPDWDFEGRDEAMLEWGVPEELIAHASYPNSSKWYPQIPPQIVIPEGWTPDQEPRLARLVPVLRAGAGLLVNGGPFDLGWFRETLPFITSLWCYGMEPTGFVGLGLISEMLEVRSLMLLPVDYEIELGHLPRLQGALVRAPGQASAIHAPNLVDYVDESAVLPPGFRVHRQLRRMSLAARNADLSAMGDLSNLEIVGLDGVRSVDLSPFAGSTRLRILVVSRSRTVTGVAGLAHCDNLESVVFSSAGEIDDLAALKNIRTPDFEGSGRPFDDAFKADVADRSGWSIRPARARQTGPDHPPSAFSIITTAEDLVEVTFREFEWLQDQLSTAHETPELLGGDIESIIEAHLTKDKTTWLGDGGLMRFDAEDDRVTMIVPNTQTAEQLVAQLDVLFHNKRRLRATAKRAGIT